MKTLPLLTLACLWLAFAGCAGEQRLLEGDVEPFKAVVSFTWPEPAKPDSTGASASSEASGAPAPGGGATATEAPGTANQLDEREEPCAGGLQRKEVQDAILAGFNEYQIFSDIVHAQATDDAALRRVAENEEADLIVRLDITNLGTSLGDESRSWELGTLDVVLWLGTGILAWWVPDVSYGTRSDIALKFKSVEEKDWLDESLSSGDHGLSLWDRAKLWGYPQAYLLGIVIPPVWNPLSDESEVNRSLATRAIDDIKRDLATTLRRSLTDIKAPFRFKLDSPPNGSTVSGSTVNLQFKYRSTSAEAKDFIPLGSLMITTRDGDGKPVFKKEFDQKELDRINDQIKRDQLIDQEVTLGPGVNLIRFVGKTEILDRWVRNTVVVTSQ